MSNSQAVKKRCWHIVVSVHNAWSDTLHPQHSYLPYQPHAKTIMLLSLNAYSSYRLSACRTVYSDVIGRERDTDTNLFYSTDAETSNLHAHHLHFTFMYTVCIFMCMSCVRLTDMLHGCCWTLFMLSASTAFPPMSSGVFSRHGVQCSSE